MKARAARIAIITASLPELAKRQWRAQAMREVRISASSISCLVGSPKQVPEAITSVTAAMICGFAWPWISVV